MLNASLPNFQFYKKSKNTRINEFTRRLGTALTTRSQQSSSENAVTSINTESQYILLEHVKRNIFFFKF